MQNVPAHKCQLSGALAHSVFSKSSKYTLEDIEIALEVDTADSK